MADAKTTAENLVMIAGKPRDLNIPKDLLQIALDRLDDETTTKEELERILKFVLSTTNSLWDSAITTANRDDDRRMHNKLIPVEYDIKEALAAENRPAPQLTSRISEFDFDIEQSELQNTDDLKRFVEAVGNLFDWHKSKKQKSLYTAPYFTMVQSSGMGKTKLLYEAKKRGNDQVEGEQESFTFCEEGVAWRLVLCTSGGVESIGETKNVFDHKLRVPNKCSEDLRRLVWEHLDNILKDAKKQSTGGKNKIVLLFDESNVLMKSDGWYFRSVRWWLKEKKRDTWVVAVFAGTTSRLANFSAEPAESVTSRDAPSGFHESGEKLYPPFYEITTTGLGVLQPICYSGSPVTEYDESIAFGRPLFHRMRMNGTLEEKEGHILNRMLRTKVGDSPGLGGYGTNELFGILGTRVQMGQVDFEMASNLVAFGYAALSYFHLEGQYAVADIAFLPDPVCARLAMMLMIEGFNIEEALCNPPQTLHGISGEAPSFWTRKATKIFSRGLCRPQKGDVREVAAALYMLFCADSLRANSADKKLKTFSVDFNEWVLTMLNPGTAEVSSAEAMTTLGQNSGSANQGSSQQKMGGSEEGETYSASVSFIQVCQNFLRHSLKGICEKGMLEQWYKAGRALYVSANCPAYDIIAPIRYCVGGDDCYCPLLVSIKNRIIYSDAQQEAAHEAMADVMKEFNVKTGVALLLLLGLDKDENVSQQKLLSHSRTQFGPGLLHVTVIVPQGDVFGIDDLVRGSTIGGGERSEVFSSQAEIRLLGTGSCVAANLLRTTTSETATQQFLGTLLDNERKAIKTSVETPHDESKVTATSSSGAQGAKRKLDCAQATKTSSEEQGAKRQTQTL